MTRLRRSVRREAALPVIGAIVLAYPPVRSHRAQVSEPAAVALGTGIGFVLFAILARERGLPRLGSRAVAAFPFVAVRAAAEECVWRRGLLLALAPRLGSGGASAVSSFAFATAHGLDQTARQFTVRAALGAVFAATFLTTGLLGAITAHSVYNTLVVGALASRSVERR